MLSEKKEKVLAMDIRSNCGYQNNNQSVMVVFTLRR